MKVLALDLSHRSDEDALVAEAWEDARASRGAASSGSRDDWRASRSSARARASSMARHSTGTATNAQSHAVQNTA